MPQTRPFSSNDSSQLYDLLLMLRYVLFISLVMYVSVTQAVQECARLQERLTTPEGSSHTFLAMSYHERLTKSAFTSPMHEAKWEAAIRTTEKLMDHD
ncbi:hypothetical protein GY45DRAFT_247872 [Cubamyces sp. BRFM 1775]|nr:hypothetical protein GY45DRAFT_247872 [Cubamyces sp. BRFM 1775]